MHVFSCVCNTKYTGSPPWRSVSLRFPESPSQHCSAHEYHRTPLQPYTLQDHTHLSALTLCTNASPLHLVYLTHTVLSAAPAHTDFLMHILHNGVLGIQRKMCSPLKEGAAKENLIQNTKSPQNSKKIEARCGGRTDTKLAQARKSTCRGREAYPATLRCRVSETSEHIRVSRSTD
jgi:hypothetical protein